MIELCRGLVVPTAPRQAAVEADRGSLVRAENHAGGIPGIDPELVIVISARRAAHDRNCLSAVLRSVKSNIRNVDHIGILRIDGDAIEVPCATRESRISIREHPCVASIVRPIEAGLFRLGLSCLRFCYLDERIHALAVRRNVDANPSPIAFGQPVSSSIDIDTSPRLAPILRTVKPATRSINRSVRAPRRPPRMPCARKQNLRRAGTDRQI